MRTSVLHTAPTTPLEKSLGRKHITKLLFKRSSLSNEMSKWRKKHIFLGRQKDHAAPPTGII
jgi:hypothetical protein